MVELAGRGVRVLSPVSSHPEFIVMPLYFLSQFLLPLVGFFVGFKALRQERLATRVMGAGAMLICIAVELDYVPFVMRGIKI
jgi:hypothetical protein